MKHLLYEHQNSLTEMKAEGTVVMKLAQKEHRSQEGTLRKDMRALKAELKEQELAGEVVVKNLRLVGARAGCRGRRAPEGVRPGRPALAAKPRILSQTRAAE